jgi:multidrug efflux pump subunit AcrB
VIPISIFIGFGLLDQSGFAIQQLSIVGLIVALGLLVDNAIVVTTNISRWMDKGADPMTAAKEGTSEVSWAITSGTITTILSFLPILAMQTSAGSFIRSLPLIVVYALLASLMIALLFTPMFSVWIFKKRNRYSKPPKTTWGMRAFNRMAEGPYQWLLIKSIRFSKTFILLALLGFVGSLSLFKSVGVSFFPKAENNRVLINIELPQSSSLSQTLVVTEQVERMLDGVSEIESYATNIGRGNPRIYYSETPPAEMANKAQIFVQIAARDSAHYWQINALLKTMFSDFPAAEVVVKDFQQGTPIDAPVVIRLFGENFEQLVSVSREIEDIIVQTSGTENVQNPVGQTKLDLQVNINRERAALLYLPIAAIDDAIRMSLVGSYIGKYRDEYGDDFNITIKLSDPNGATLSDFDKIMVENTQGQLLPLMQVASLELVSVPAHIQHHNSQRSSKITAHVSHGQNVERVTQQINEKLEQYDFPNGISYQIGGERKSRGEAFLGFVKSIIIALFGIFTVLVFQFRSFSQPVIVFVAIPFAISGAILALYFTGYSFSFMAFLGVAGLVGIVVNNAIILIDSANSNNQQGMSKYHACLNASKIRLTPVLLTTLTTVVSLIPIALQGSLTWSPLAWVIIGGLLVSTVISLILVPVLYTFFSAKTEQLQPILEESI